MADDLPPSGRLHSLKVLVHEVTVIRSLTIYSLIIKPMLIFLDTEFIDFIDCELRSIGMVSEDGQHACYLEVQDFDRAKCNSFVQSAVWSQLGKFGDAIVLKHALQDRLRDWFATLPSSITLTCDSQHDRDLLADILDGQWPENLQGWFDLRPLIDTGVFNHAVTRYHTPDKPWHHALYDAHAHRAGWMAWMDAHQNREQ